MVKNKKILLVEDNPDQAEIYHVELENTGFNVLLAQNAEDALKKAEEDSPKLILLDPMLGNSSGLDLLKKLKENPAIKAIKVVAITNFREKDLLEGERLVGIYDYIFKPDFTPREVAQKVREYLES